MSRKKPWAQQVVEKTRRMGPAKEGTFRGLVVSLVDRALGGDGSLPKQPQGSNPDKR